MESARNIALAFDLVVLRRSASVTRTRSTKMAADGKFNMVAEEGNRRRGGMGKAEISQCVLGESSQWYL